MSKAIQRAVAHLAAMSPVAEIIVSLQTFTSRDLTANPPGADEKLGPDLGIGDSNLDKFIRPWINKRFRVPAGDPRLPPGAIKGDTTFKQLCKMAGVDV
jgi:hypothetical protein